jgi:hypothetical protein
MILPPVENSENVTVLPVKQREPVDEGAFLRPVPPGKCIHFNTSFEVDVDGGKCKCLGCGEEVTPIFVLQQLMNKESRWNRTREAYQEEMRRLKERSSTKCNHCGQMTRISHR